jgi:5'-deoxynucleotidase
MKYIERWSLMRSTLKESILTHSADVAIYAQALAAIGNAVFGKNLDVGKAASVALYHDVSEVITGDLASPVKYFNPEITAAYKKLEAAASNKLLSMLPEELKPQYSDFFYPDESSYEYKLVKAADKLSAYIKCVEELASGNGEFSVAAETTKKMLDETDLPELKYFLENFMDGYGKPLDLLK